MKYTKAPIERLIEILKKLKECVEDNDLIV